MKEYFVISDSHSFYSIVRKSLFKAGFRKTNKDHILVVLGDVFDRGPETLEMYDFIMSIPKSRRILVRGNHEPLFLKLLNDKQFPDDYDYHNGTVGTFCQIAHEDEKKLYRSYWYSNLYLEHGDLSDAPIIDVGEYVSRNIVKTWDHVRDEVRKSEIVDWLVSDEWVNYFEMDRFVMVHSFIPLKPKEEYEQYAAIGYQIPDWACTYDPNWREPTANWYEAVWGCPYTQFDAGFFKPEADKGKVLVCGHWHASDFHRRYEGDCSKNFEIYFGKNLIAIDACTYSSKMSNVLHIKFVDGEWTCFDKYGNKLEPKKKETENAGN